MVHSDDAKARAAAKGTASPRIIAKEVSVQPVGSESESKDCASNLDDSMLRKLAVRVSNSSRYSIKSRRLEKAKSERIAYGR
jgi:hypothetical protein